MRADRLVALLTLLVAAAPPLRAGQAPAVRVGRDYYLVNSTFAWF